MHSKQNTAHANDNSLDTLYMDVGPRNISLFKTTVRFASSDIYDLVDPYPGFAPTVLGGIPIPAHSPPNKRPGPLNVIPAPLPTITFQPLSVRTWEELFLKKFGGPIAFQHLTTLHLSSIATDRSLKG